MIGFHMFKNKVQLILHIKNSLIVSNSDFQDFSALV